MVSRPPADAGSVSLDDVRVVKQMAAGDAQALGRFYDRWSHHVYSTVRAIVHSPQDAEEIVGDCFWQAWTQASRFDPSRGDVRVWLLNIARSRALDRLKSMKRRREEDLEAAPADSFATLPDAEEKIDQAARAVQVADALKILPEAQRKVLEMVYYGGLTQTEIADSTGEALGTIKTRIRLGTQKLRDTIGHLQARNA
jgi:RNA polymerase sigma-70 factor (ECF subfamily)